MYQSIILKNILIKSIVGMTGSILLTKLLSRKDFFNINFSKKFKIKNF